MVWLKRISFAVLMMVLLLILVEGASSWGLFVYDACTNAEGSRPTYLRHDKDLGWSARPGVRLEHHFGPERHVTIDDRGARRVIHQPFDGRRLRIVCSGDSFTFGYGVRDEDAWPFVMTQLEPRFEVTNLAMSGYGVDQMYLRYLRDGVDLPQDVHIIAAIRDDFFRMRHRSFCGYDKPVLVERDGAIAADGVPVPRATLQWGGFLQRNTKLLHGLRTFQAGARLVASDPPPPKPPTDETVALGIRAIAELARRGAERGVRTAFVMLPMPDFRLATFDRPRQEALQLLRNHGILVVDLIDAIRREPPDQAVGYFIPAGALKYEGAAGHLTAAGGQFVAGHVRRALLADSRIAATLR